MCIDRRYAGTHIANQRLKGGFFDARFACQLESEAAFNFAPLSCPRLCQRQRPPTVGTVRHVDVTSYSSIVQTYRDTCTVRQLSSGRVGTKWLQVEALRRMLQNHVLQQGVPESRMGESQVSGLCSPVIASRIRKSAATGDHANPKLPVPWNLFC